MPAQLQDALKHALLCLSFEEMLDEDQPPRRIWHDIEALRDHFDKVKARRKQETSHPSDVRFDDPVENAAVRDILIEE